MIAPGGLCAIAIRFSWVRCALWACVTRLLKTSSLITAKNRQAVVKECMWEIDGAGTSGSDLVVNCMFEQECQPPFRYDDVRDVRNSWNVE